MLKKTYHLCFNIKWPNNYQCYKPVFQTNLTFSCSRRISKRFLLSLKAFAISAVENFLNSLQTYMICIQDIYRNKAVMRFGLMT